MDEQTHKALIASIEKWERNAEAETPEEYLIGTRDCALCALFWKGDCAGCPVSEASGELYCNGTPYLEADHAEKMWVQALNVPFDEAAITHRRNAAHAAARKEVDFLKSLLPEGVGHE